MTYVIPILLTPETINGHPRSRKGTPADPGSRMDPQGAPGSAQMTPQRPQPQPKGAQFGHAPFPPREPAPTVKEHDQKAGPGKPWEPKGHKKELSGSTQSTHLAPQGAPGTPKEPQEPPKGF
jgi:hypothetical protein